MANPNSPIPLKSILGFIVILLVIATVWFLISSVNNNLNTALSPLRQTNNMLSTQVSELLHPTPTVLPDPVTIINEVRALARLETIQYTVEKVITAEVNQGVLGPLFGDRLLFVAHGTVIAGIDMSQIASQDMWIQDSVLNVRLPAAEIFTVTLDNQKSYVYDRQTGLLTHGDVNLETAARQVAEDQIQQAALDDGILATAEQNAEAYLSRLFQALGYPEVIFMQPTSTPTP
jgi:hypothetical protein